MFSIALTTCCSSVDLKRSVTPGCLSAPLSRHRQGYIHVWPHRVAQFVPNPRTHTAPPTVTGLPRGAFVALFSGHCRHSTTGRVADRKLKLMTKVRNSDVKNVELNVFFTSKFRNFVTVTALVCVLSTNETCLLIGRVCRWHVSLYL